MREDEHEIRLRTQAPQLGRDPVRQSAAQVRVRGPGSAFSSPVLERMVRQCQYAQPRSARRHDHPAMGAVDLHVRAHGNNARDAQMPQGVSEGVYTKVEHVIVRQAHDARPDRL
jgi:hypothetical protein